MRQCKQSHSIETWLKYNDNWDFDTIEQIFSTFYGKLLKILRNDSPFFTIKLFESDEEKWNWKVTVDSKSFRRWIACQAMMLESLGPNCNCQRGFDIVFLCTSAILSWCTFLLIPQTPPVPPRTCCIFTLETCAGVEVFFPSHLHVLCWETPFETAFFFKLWKGWNVLPRHSKWRITMTLFQWLSTTTTTIMNPTICTNQSMKCTREQNLSSE